MWQSREIFDGDILFDFCDGVIDELLDGLGAFDEGLFEEADFAIPYGQFCVDISFFVFRGMFIEFTFLVSVF